MEGEPARIKGQLRAGPSTQESVSVKVDQEHGNPAETNAGLGSQESVTIEIFLQSLTPWVPLLPAATPV